MIEKNKSEKNREDVYKNKHLIIDYFIKDY